ncbi:MAG TPA: response regulator [Candidatus Limnocylindrales bacterium]|nr:response regulator [Candidatus Limnocylindrales bacterium]
MPESEPSSPSFADLLLQGQAFLQGLQAFEAEVSAELADRHAELGRLRQGILTLEQEAAGFQESRRQWGLERDRFAAQVASLQQAMVELEARVAQERTRVEAEQAEAAERSERERAELARRLDAREASLGQARTEAEALASQVEQLQAAQLAWAADRQDLEARQDELRTAHEAELARLTGALAAVRADLETLQAYQIEWAAEREAHLKGRKDTQELIAQAGRQTAEASAKRQGLVAEIQQLNQELTAALGALARMQERERLQEKAAEAERRGWEQERAELEALLRTARESPQTTAITPERLHALSSDLNAVTGFSELLAQEAMNKITPEERQEFVRLIKESAARIVDDLGGLGATGAPATLEVPEAPTGPAVPVILLADPDARARERVQPFLERAGYEVLVAANAADAMAQALARQPLAVLVDAALPPGGGAALLRDLKRELRTRDIPTVITAEEGAASTLDEGTDFLLKPIDRQRLLQVMVKLDLMADGQRARKMPGTVLLIDDDRRHARLLKAVFKPFAIKLLTAETADEGIALATSQRPDLIILDLTLGSGDGFAVVDAVSGTPEVARTPIIVLTARGLNGRDGARLKGRVQTVLAKGDFNRERLLELVLRRGERRGRGKAAA